AAECGGPSVLDGWGRAFDPDVVDVLRRVVTPYPPGIEVELGDGRRGVVVSVPQNNLTRPLVRIGWDAGGRPVSHYELDTATEPDLAVVCITARGTTSREEEPPPLPTRPEPSQDELAAARAARTAAATP